MILSNSYKKAMDKIELSDELKTKIIQNTSDIKSYNKNNRYKKIYFKKAAGLAACLVFSVVSYRAVKSYYNTPVDMIANVPTQNSNTVNSDVPPAVKTPDNKNENNKKIDENSTTAKKADVYSNKVGATNSISAADNKESVENEAEKTQDAPLVAAADNKKSVESEAEKTQDAPLATAPDTSLSENEYSQSEDLCYESLGSYAGENEISSIDDIEEQLGYEIKVPNYVPNGYEISNMSVLFGETAEINYENKTDTLCYRTGKGADDISGDYNSYENIETLNIDNIDRTFKGNGDLYNNVVWTDDDKTYSVTSITGIEKAEMISVVKSVEAHNTNNIQNKKEP